MRRAAIALCLLAACASPAPARTPDASVPDVPGDLTNAPDAPDASDAPDGCALACEGACVDPSSDPDHCGACGTACGAGAWCADGRCACSAPQTWCPGVGCVDPTADRDHCGGCATVCPPGAACTSGRCAVPCPAGTHRCAGACARDDDPTACGAGCAACGTPEHATTSCFLGGCTFRCESGTHACGGRCVPDGDVTQCGDACAPCSAPLHGAPACVAGACSAVCEPGWHPCGARCAPDDDPATCGASCVPCRPPAHGAATCAGGACDFTCSPGFRRCGDACSDGTSPLGCGTACVRCTVPAHGAALCTAGACGLRCDPGWHPCGGDCLADASPASCGASCDPCTAPPHATATCAGGGCAWACDPGYTVSGGRCVGLPRLRWPPSGALVTSRRPVFRWSAPDDAPGALAEVCRDRPCSTVVATLPGVAAADGTAPATDLPPGVLWWRARTADGARTSATWQLTVPARSGAVPSAWGAVTDVDSDGYGDALVGLPLLPRPDARVYVYRGGPAGLRPAPTVLEPPDGNAQFGYSVAPAGDVDGDGYMDALVGAPLYMSLGGRAYVYRGGARGLSDTASAVLTGPDGPEAWFGAAVAGIGDLDGDGYADVAVGAFLVAGGGRVYVYRGGIAGLGQDPATVLLPPGGADSRFGFAVAGAGDVDGDGYSDLLVGADGVTGFAGRAYLYRGGPAGLSATPTVTLMVPDGSRFGAAVAGVGDVDGDGLPDLAVGSLGTAVGAGRVVVYRGASGGVDPVPAGSVAGPGGSYGAFGAAVAGAGDVDGDGYDDLLVGAPQVDSFTGAAYLFRGGAAGLGAIPAVLPGPGTHDSYFGGTVAGARDVDGDGFADVLAGAERTMGFAGQVRIYLGSPTGPGAPVVLMGPDGPGGRFGWSVAVLPRRTLPGG